METEYASIVPSPFLDHYNLYIKYECLLHVFSFICSFENVKSHTIRKKHLCVRVLFLPFSLSLSIFKSMFIFLFAILHFSLSSRIVVLLLFFSFIFFSTLIVAGIHMTRIYSVAHSNSILNRFPHRKKRIK